MEKAECGYLHLTNETLGRGQVAGVLSLVIKTPSSHLSPWVVVQVFYYSMWKEGKKTAGKRAFTTFPQ